MTHSVDTTLVRIIISDMMTKDAHRYDRVYTWQCVVYAYLYNVGIQKFCF